MGRRKLKNFSPLSLFKMKKKKLFNLRTNKTGKRQVYRYKESGSIITVPPNCTLDSYTLKDGYHNLASVEQRYVGELSDRGIKKFYLERKFSLGDMLMLVPVYRELMGRGFTPYIRTLTQFCDLLSRLEVYNESTEIISDPKTPGIMLDYTVERDHFVKELQQTHRVEIYHKIIGLPFRPEYLDWSFKKEQFPETNFFDGKPYVVFQGRGATKRRGLSAEVIQELIYFFNLEGINVVYIGSKVDDLKGDEKHTIFQFMKSTLPELFSLISGAKVVIAMDSSPIWVSHYTKTPTIAILGPSRPSERIALHPLYPDFVKAICLNKDIKCESCFEQSAACNHMFDCLYLAKSERIYESIRNYLIEFEMLKLWGSNDN
jgi:hypothetical protein